MSNMYNKIGQIARDNWGKRITYGDLANMIGVNSPYLAGQQIERASDYFARRGDSGTVAAIARCFWGKYAV